MAAADEIADLQPALFSPFLFLTLAALLFNLLFAQLT
jgi:hypothetical protein